MIHTEKKQQARELYAHTDLTKTQIAKTVGVDRRTVTNWVLNEHWDRLRRAAQHLPAILIENCYHLLGLQLRHFLSEARVTKPLTLPETDTLYRLTGVITRLKGRTCLNESMEAFSMLNAHLSKKDKPMADALSPHIDEVLSEQASIFRGGMLPPGHTGLWGTIPWATDLEREAQEEEDRIEQEEILDHPHTTIYSDGSIVPSHGRILDEQRMREFQYGKDPAPTPAQDPAQDPAQIAPADKNDSDPCTVDVRSTCDQRTTKATPKPLKKLNISQLKKAQVKRKKERENVQIPGPLSRSRKGR